MIRMARLTDYGILLMTWFARQQDDSPHSARELASMARLPVPTVSKILKELARQGLLIGQRGVKGGFRLARPAAKISVADIVNALEGPISFTDCGGDPGACDLEDSCIVRSNWKKIDHAVRGALEGITLSEMTHPLALVPPPISRRPTRQQV